MKTMLAISSSCIKYFETAETCIINNTYSNLGILESFFTKYKLKIKEELANKFRASSEPGRRTGF